MKKILTSTLLTILACSLLNAQDILEKKFYKKIDLKGETIEKNAKYVQVKIQENDSIVVFELRDLKNNELIESKKYCNYIPYGKCLYYSKYTKDNYEITYNNTDKTGLITYDIRKRTSDCAEQTKFENPIFPNLQNDFIFYIAKSLRYPEEAYDKGLTGKVITQFILDENGQITDFSILGKAQPILDREATRVVLSSPEWFPAKVDGVPVKVYIEYIVNFTL